MKFQTGNFKKLCFQTAKRKPYFHSTEKKMLLNSFCLNQTQPELLNGFCHPQILFSFPVTEAPTQGAPSPFTNFPSSCQPCTQIPTKSLLWENLLLPKPHIPPGGVDNKVWRQKPLWMQQILTGQPGAESCCALSPSHPNSIPSPSHFAQLLLAAASPTPSCVQLGKFGQLYFAQPGAAHFRFARNVLQLNTE